MANTVYNVIISTPMGDMDGRAEINTDGPSLSGVLRLLGKDNPFSDGTINEDGTFAFEGHIKILMGKLAYSITGTLKDGRIEASCQTKMGEMKIRSK